MIRISAICLYVLLFPLCLWSQNFGEGFIVKQGGDTLFGQLSLEFNENIQHQVLFRPDKHQEAHIYSISELSSISKDGGLFLVNPISYTEVDDQQISLLGFVELILEGDISLYRFRTPRYRKVFYIQEKGGVLQELIHTGMKSRTIGDKHFQVEDKRYISTLQVFLAACSQLEQKIDNTPYNARALRKLLVDWHACQDLTFEEPSKEASSGLNLNGLRIAYSLNPQNFDREGWRKSSIVQGLEVATELHLKGFSLFHIQAGAELIVFQYSLDQVIYSFPISMVKRMPLQTGELFGKLGFVPMTRFVRDNPLPIGEGGSKSVVLFQASLEYEFPFPRKTPIFMELRGMLQSLQSPLVGVKAGIKL